MVAAALLHASDTGNSIHQCYPEVWSLRPWLAENFNIAVVAGGSTGASYLYAPLNLRPFGVRLPDISIHRRLGQCRPAYDVDKEDGNMVNSPRWMVCRDSCTQATDGGYAGWRRRQMDLELHALPPGLRRVYVACSLCGEGLWLSLPNHSSLFDDSMRSPHVVAQWE
jgi:hypothetical protein